MEKENSVQLYFIAIIPPSPVMEEAMELKTYFKNKYNSKASLNSPPHITLHMPFRWEEREEHVLIKKLADFAKPFHPFELTLSNFNCFPPRVIYIKVVKNQLLEKLHQDLHQFCKAEFNLSNADYQERPFHRHVTLAFRDLRKQQFQIAWQEFKEKEFRRTIAVQAIVLMRHDGLKWKEFSQCHFTQQA